MNYYQRHIGDYIRDTAHLSLLEHGIYARLLDLYYLREGPLPADGIMRLLGARTDQEREAVAAVLTEFFEPVEGAWRHGRCDKEIALANDAMERAKQAGRVGAAKRWHKGSDSPPNGDPIAPLSESHKGSDGGWIAPNLQPPTNKNKSPADAEAVKKRKATKTPIPPDFALDDAMREAMLSRHPDCDADQAFAQFRAHHESHGKAMANWRQAWTTWIGNAGQFGYPKRQNKPASIFGTGMDWR